jgi:hypothetical protein
VAKLSAAQRGTLAENEASPLHPHYISEFRGGMYGGISGGAARGIRNVASCACDRTMISNVKVDLYRHMYRLSSDAIERAEARLTELNELLTESGKDTIVKP